MAEVMQKPRTVGKCKSLLPGQLPSAPISTCGGSNEAGRWAWKEGQERGEGGEGSPVFC